MRKWCFPRFSARAGLCPGSVVVGSWVEGGGSRDVGLQPPRGTSIDGT